MRALCRALLLSLLLLLPALAGAAQFTWFKGTLQTWITDSTNVTNNSRVLGAAITLTNANFTRADCELNVPSWSGTVAANTGIALWLVTRSDGTNYEDGDASTDPARAADVVFPLRNVSTAQRVLVRGIELPRDLFKPLVKNDGTSVTMQGATTAWTLKCTPYVLQSN